MDPAHRVVSSGCDGNVFELNLLLVEMRKGVYRAMAMLGLILLLTGSSGLLAKSPGFKVLVLTERGGQHEGFVVAALDWLNIYAAEKNFDVTVINHAGDINDTMLVKYKVIIQLNYPP